MRGKSYSNNSKLKAFRGGETKVMSKKFIAIISALALVVTLLAPVGVQEASAASKNTVDRVVTVSSNTTISAASAPTLKLEKDGSDWRSSSETLRLELPSSAEWPQTVTYDVYDDGDNHLGTFTADRLTDQWVQLQVNGPAAEYVLVSFAGVEFSGATGEQKVVVNALDSAFTSGSYTFAVATTGKTIATTGAKQTINRGGNEIGATIIIEEAVIGSLSDRDHVIRLRLPNNFSWNTTDADLNVNGFEAAAGANATVTRNDGRDLEITLTLANETTERRGSLIITPRINPSRDARHGEVTVNITSLKGDISNATGLVVAEYADYAINVEIEEVKEFVAGRYSDDYRTAKITLKETVENSFIENRVIDFELPSWAKIVSGSGINVKSKHGNDFTISNNEIYGKRSKFEIEVTQSRFGSNNNKREIEFEIPITFSANRSGEVVMKVKGAGVPEQELVIAEVIAPVTAEVKVSDVRLGIQNQPAAEIIIKENVAGAIQKVNDGDDLVLGFVNDIGFRFDTAKFEVIDGGEYALEIDQDNSGRTRSSSDSSANTALKINLKSESDEPSTIRVYDIAMTVDRTAPEGLIQLDIKGAGLVQNNIKPYSDDFSGRVARFDFANVVTPAPGEVRGTSVFTIDSTTYTVVIDGQEVERTMDVAPYIKDSRTFLPVFFVAQALGVSEQNIIWEPHSKTVTIYKGDRIAQMQIGNNVLTVNGISVRMDTAPEIKDGRTMLPIYYVGQALGASVEWDADTRSVTISQ